MEVRKNKLRSLIKQVQSSTGEIFSPNSSHSIGKEKSKFLSKSLLSLTSSNVNSSSKSSTSTSNNTQLDLNSAIQYNHYLTSSYLEEKSTREVPLYDQIISGLEETEQQVIDSISKEFYLNSYPDEKTDQTTNDTNLPSSIIKLDKTQKNEDTCDSRKTDDLTLQKSEQVEDYGEKTIENVLINTENKCIDDQSDDFKSNEDTLKNSYCQSKLLELCILQNLPSFDCEQDDGKEFLTYINKEKDKLTKQVTIVSKRLSDMIVANEQHFSVELGRIRSIELNLVNTIQICSDGRKSLSHSKRDFTSSGLSIIENHKRREAIVNVIECLNNIKTVRNTIDHIQTLLELEKNFPTAIHLYNETFDIIKALALKYRCVDEMRSKLVDMLLTAETQMDSVLSRMPDRFCTETYHQLCKAYKQIGKSENAICQLLMHFTNAVYDKAFSIVLGYVELFADNGTFTDLVLGTATASSTPVKGKKCKNIADIGTISGSDLKRKPFAELCQYLKPESFLSCLTDLCRSMWDIMQNYCRILNFYQLDDVENSTGLTTEEVAFALSKVQNGVLRVWSDVQHKIRTLVSSVKFVEMVQHAQNLSLNSADDVEHNDSTSDRQCFETTNLSLNQDQLLFSFEEFIKILTVCEKMVEIGEEFCHLYPKTHNTEMADISGSTVDLQNTLYKQTRAYFQSYHQVSMAELRIFLENETWTRCPIDTKDEFVLISNLQEFSFMKNRLLKLRKDLNNSGELSVQSKTQNQFTRAGSISSPTKESSSTKISSSSSSFLLSPVAKSKQYFRTYFNQHVSLNDLDLTNTEMDKYSPFDEILSVSFSQQVSDTEMDSEVVEEKNSGFNEELEMEIVTTNTALNVLRLIGRYMHIMYLLRPISDDVIKALVELFDYYFFTVHRFFATDTVQSSFRLVVQSCANICLWSTTLYPASSSATPSPSVANSSINLIESMSTNSQQLISQFSTELRQLIRRKNDNSQVIADSSNVTSGSSTLHSQQSANTVVNNTSLNESSVHNVSLNMSTHQQTSKPTSAINAEAPSSASSSANCSPKHLIKYPCPMLPSYVPINSSNSLFALCERIMAIESIIFISRQFYHLCPFLLDFLRIETEDVESIIKKSNEESFKLLQFYNDQMCINVDSLLRQCLFAVTSKIFSYETIMASMGQIKWDLKEIPSIHSSYVDLFVQEIQTFDQTYRKLLKSNDLDFLLPSPVNQNSTSNQHTNSIGKLYTSDELDFPLVRLYHLSTRMNPLLWECLIRITNQTFVEVFSTAKKCTNEGRALMQLDYQQFLSHVEKIMLPYFGPNCNGQQDNSGGGVRAVKSLLSTEKEHVEEFVKAFYLTENIFIDWIRKRPNYTAKQIVSLINCIANDNRKLRSTLLAAVDAATIESTSSPNATIPIGAGGSNPSNNTANAT